MRLTDRQQKTIRRFAKDGTATISPDVARQLIKKGLIRHDRDHVRKEWNRPVATLWVCSLTVAGQEILVKNR